MMGRRRRSVNGNYTYAFGGAVKLDMRETEYVHVPYNANQVFGSGDWTISMWVYLSNSGIGTAVFFRSHTAVNRMLLQVGGGNPATIVFTVRDSTGTRTFNVPYTFPKSQWVHLILTRRGGSAAANGNLNSMRIGVNGQLASGPDVASSGASTWESANAPTRFFIYNNTNGEPSKVYQSSAPAVACLDDYWIAKAGVTDAEMLEVFKDGIGSGPPERIHDQLILNTHFDEQEGTTGYNTANTYNQSVAVFPNAEIRFADPAKTAPKPNPQSIWIDHFTLQP